MYTKILISGFAMMLSTGILYAGTPSGFDLESNMVELNKHMVDLQAAFIRGDKGKALQAVSALGAESSKLLADETVMKKMLPKGKEHMVRVAITSARMIEEDVEIMKESMDNTRRETAQEAYLGIQRACMRCHNLVRDW